MKKIAVVTGTRAEYGILRSLIHEINQNKNFELILVVTGSHLSKNHGMTIKEIIKDGFKISSKININQKGDESIDSTKAMGKAIIEFAKFFNKFNPHMNIILGDRYEMFASAIAAYQMNIPNVHIHGGDVSGGLDEYTRHAITKISNIHFAATKKSSERIKKMGEKSKYVFHTGSLGIDEILKKKITKKHELEKKYNMKLDGENILLVQHPVTTESKKTEKQISETMEAILKINKNTIIIGPNSDSGHKSIQKIIKKKIRGNNIIKIYNNVPRQDFLGFLNNCGVLIGNSSSGIIEASMFKIPVVNIGTRQKNREHGPNVINVKEFSRKTIEIAIRKALYKNKSKLKNSKIYGDKKVGEKMINILKKINVDDQLMKKGLTY
ncbi:MAG: UDP-N-acetylglucosamine 2-epimerase (hydrolyzing) [Thaumarchaeota archaeon]|jgi:UDP-N-acetylglucosamine 2-epimerase (non-hydrolysing)/GDP/UDP-N,N'-diacetylbacillosamine 2-epimerase (hydrolysing)|nr:MAG: UDP-N-acetylglucosamine 2-epimerase (hydrolyzing) [Nitrososphaerota archaeon]